MRLAGCLLSAFCLAALLSVVAADDKKADKKETKKPAANQAFTFPKAITLTKEQDEKLAALQKEYGPQLQEINAKAAKVMTPERQKTAAAVRKEAAAAGKKGKELQEAVNTALKLSAEEQDQLKAVNQERAKLMKEINEKKSALLTEEQKAQLKPKPKSDK